MKIMRKLDTMPLRKEQARILRLKGISYGKVAELTGLTKGIVVNIGRSIGKVTEDRTLDQRMENGEACLYCGSPLSKQTGTGRKHRYCSEECRRAYWRIHRSELRKKPESIYVHTCAYCGKTFEVYGKVDRKYCSRHCFMLHRNGHNFNNFEAIK